MQQDPVISAPQAVGAPVPIVQAPSPAPAPANSGDEAINSVID